jgi:hypothetical protein
MFVYCKGNVRRSLTYSVTDSRHLGITEYDTPSSHYLQSCFVSDTKNADATSSMSFIIGSAKNF